MRKGRHGGRPLSAAISHLNPDEKEETAGILVDLCVKGQ